MKLMVDGRSYEVEVQGDGVVVDGTPYKTTILRDNGDVTVRVAGRPYRLKIAGEKTVTVDGRQFCVEIIGRNGVGRRAPATTRANGNSSGNRNSSTAEKGAVQALMPGTVLALRVKEGDQIAAGAVLLILEAMKMQNEIRASHAGVVKHIAVAAGQTVCKGSVMLVID